MSVFVDEPSIHTVYADVRNDANETNWCVLKYEGKKIKVDSTGSIYDEMTAKMGDDERVYAYVRIETGDEMAKRVRYAFITWIGPSVSPLKKAKVSTDKAFVKQIFSEFGKEFLCDDPKEYAYDKVKSILEKASGAAYGTGK